MNQAILTAFGFEENRCTVTPFGSGLINDTWKLACGNKQYILQRINTGVFHQPQNIAHNIHLVGQTLKVQHPDYLFVAPLPSVSGEEMVEDAQKGCYRLFPFVANSHTFDVVDTPDQAFEAARQFGRFTRLLSGVDTGELKITIPQFHDLSLRYQQFLSAVKAGNPQRIQQSQPLIEELLGHAAIVDTYKGITENPAFRLRVTHHDTKISNVLFDSGNNGLCVIDLDTIMPGYFISDVGDMMRTYLSPVSEEEGDFSKIEIRDEIYRAIVSGYYGEMQDELTEVEARHFFYAGKFMIYMQALRFLTDHLNNDSYYGAKYEDHNLVRAGNQAVLLNCLLQKEAVLAGDERLATAQG